jgi:hypothetical protein
MSQATPPGGAGGFPAPRAIPPHEEVPDALEVRRTFFVPAAHAAAFEAWVLGRPDPGMPGVVAVDAKLAEVPDEPGRYLAVVVYQPPGPAVGVDAPGAAG